VLGVPEGRVWELLARGVISGVPEGDSMRVHLKARPEPIATAPQPPKANGNGGSNGGSEASAFRELLTEFRNLTERYGQALLALGEARGEVAGLRSRVELLESRLDLRLPTPDQSAPVAWSPSEVSAPAAPDEADVAQPLADATTDAGEPPTRPAPQDAPPSPRSGGAKRRKGRSRRAAVEGIAEALARAEDPSPAELPQPEEEAQEEEAPTAAIAAEPTPEVEPPSPPPTPAGSPYSTDVVEPDWFADGDFAWLDAADLSQPAREPEPTAAPAHVQETVEPNAPNMPEAPPAPAASFPAESVDERSAVDEVDRSDLVEIDEMEAEVVSEELAVAELESAPGSAPGADPGSADEEAASPVLTLSEDELARLAADEGWGATEVEAIRSLIGSDSSPATIDLPGSADLVDAMAALEATPRETEWSKPWPETDAIRIDPEPAPIAEPVRWPPAPATQSDAPRGPAARTGEPARASEPPWLRRRRGPAASAYRTLRRLFPG